MLPPVDTSLLAANPAFEQLYNSLTTTVLNSDGSTKNDPAAQQREAVREVRHWFSYFLSLAISLFLYMGLM